MNVADQRKWARQRGAALPLVLLTLLFLTLLGYMALTTSSVEVRLAANERDYQQAVYVAEAGIAHTRAILKGLLNTCNQANISSGQPVDWDFALIDPLVCAPIAGQPGPLAIKSVFGSYQYNVTIMNNLDDIAGGPDDDEDYKIILMSIATGPNNVCAGIEVVLDAQNSSNDVTGGYTGQKGGGGTKNFVGRDANAITDPTTSTVLGRL